MKPFATLSLLATLLAGGAATISGPAVSPRVTAIVDVNVIPMDREGVLEHQTVLVEGDRITSVSDAATTAIPEGATLLAGRDRWLMPGLIDMHVHIRRRDLGDYLVHGITTVRDLAGISSVTAIAGQVARGEVMGPRILYSTPLLDGPGARNPSFAVIVSGPAEAGPTLDAQLARGCSFAKVYDSLSAEVYDAIVDAARARGVKVVGHIARAIDVRHAIDRGQDSIEHLSGYERAVTAQSTGSDVMDWISIHPDRIAALAQRTAQHNVWNCPTLWVYKVLAEQAGTAPDQVAAIVTNRRLFVRALHEAGARLLLGTDSGYLTPAGESTDFEVDELIASGLSPWEALAAGTSGAAEFLGMADRIGSIAAGRDADLMLLERNPLEDITAIRRPSGVMVRGLWITAPRRRAAGH